MSETKLDIKVKNLDLIAASCHEANVNKNPFRSQFSANKKEEETIQLIIIILEIKPEENSQMLACPGNGKFLY